MPVCAYTLHKVFETDSPSKSWERYITCEQTAAFSIKKSKKKGYVVTEGDKYCHKHAKILQKRWNGV